jgi:ArsR family transcriptional regulator
MTYVAKTKTPVLDQVLPEALCCPPVTREPLTDEQATELAGVLKAMADPVRLRLLSLIAAHDGGEACVCDLNDAFDLSQPTISHHLKLLLDAGLVAREKRGIWSYYRLVPQALDACAQLLATSTPRTNRRRS